MSERFLRRPRKLKPGLINMKYQAIVFGPLYAARDARYMDRMAEMMNLSDGTRTIAEIARVVGYEVGPIEAGLVAEIFGDLEEFGFVALES
jgi:hypothetical protein